VMMARSKGLQALSLAVRNWQHPVGKRGGRHRQLCRRFDGAPSGLCSRQWVSRCCRNFDGQATLGQSLIPQLIPQMSPPVIAAPRSAAPHHYDINPRGNDDAIPATIPRRSKDMMSVKGMMSVD
jgi:hypothetical protein